MNSESPSKLFRLTRIAFLALSLLVALALLAAAISSQFTQIALTTACRAGALDLVPHTNGLNIAFEIPRRSRSVRLFQFHAAAAAHFNTDESTPLANQYFRHLPGGFVYESEAWYENAEGAYEIAPTSPGESSCGTGYLFLPWWSLLTLTALILLLDFRIFRRLRRRTPAMPPSSTPI